MTFIFDEIKFNIGLINDIHNLRDAQNKHDFELIENLTGHIDMKIQILNDSGFLLNPEIAIKYDEQMKKIYA